MTVEEAESPSANRALLSPRYKRWLVFVLLLVSILNFADRAILAVLAQPIKEELHLTDTDLGLLQGLGFAILYSILGIPIGLWAERVNRTRLLALCVGAWSAMTVVCGFASNFVTLLLGRIGVGVGEAGAQPITNSLVSDHFEPRRRGSILAITLLGAPLGFLLGQSAGALVASEWGWRAAFYIMGAPGVLLALLILLTLREPPRGLADGALATDTAPAPTLSAVWRYLWSKPTYRHLFAAFVVAAFPMNAVANFVLPFYLRGFDMPLAQLGVLFGIVSFLSNGLGMLFGGFGFDRLSRRDPRWIMWGPAISLLLCVPVYLMAFVSSDLYSSLAFLFVGNMALSSTMAPSMATMQNLARPRMRATTSAITALAIGILGAGLGPTVAGMLSDMFATQAFDGGAFIASCPGGRAPGGPGTTLDLECLAASTEGVRWSLITVLAVFLWAALHYVLAARRVAQDVYDPSREGAA